MKEVNYKDMKFNPFNLCSINIYVIRAIRVQ